MWVGCLNRGSYVTSMYNVPFDLQCDHKLITMAVILCSKTWMIYNKCLVNSYFCSMVTKKWCIIAFIALLHQIWNWIQFTQILSRFVVWVGQILARMNEFWLKSVPSGSQFSLYWSGSSCYQHDLVSCLFGTRYQFRSRF